MAGNILPPESGDKNIGGIATPWNHLYATGDMISGDDSASFSNIIDVTNKPKIGAGACEDPTYTNNGDGTITVNACPVCLFASSDFVGPIREYDIPQKTVSLADNTLNYVVCSYNSGSPEYSVISDVSIITESDVVPILTIYRNGSFLHTIDWDALGLGLANKLHQSIVKTQRYRRESGIDLGIGASNQIIIGSGRVWVGAVPIDVDSVTSATDLTLLNYHSSGNWATSAITAINNTQYDNGTNLATLTANRYAVNWIYRGVENQKHIYVTLGSGDYTLTQAQEASPSTPPQLISSHAVLVGKVIIQKDALSPYSVQSAFEKAFTYGAITAHNDLSGRDAADVHPAESVSVDTTDFDGNLSSADDTVQKALETLDDLTVSGATPEAIRRSGYFTDNPVNFSQGTNVTDFVKFIQCTDSGDGKRKSTSGRYKKVYFNTILWDPTYSTGGATGRVTFSLKIEKFDETGYETSATFYAVAYGDNANITSSNKDSSWSYVKYSITFDATLMVQGQTYSGSETISQIHPDIFRLYNRTLTGDLIAKHRNTDPFPAAAHAIRLSPSVVRNATLDIRTVGADTCWKHTNGDFRRFLFKRLFAYDASNWGLEIYREGDTRGTYALLFTATGLNSQSATETIVTKTSTGSADGSYTFTATIDTTAGTWNLDTFDDTGMSPAFIQAAYTKYAAACAASCYSEVYGVTRTDSNTLAKTGLQTTLPLGTHIRMYSGTSRPTTASYWKHAVVSAVGTNAVDIIGEEVPTGGANLFIEADYSNADIVRISRAVSGYWAAATGTGLLANPVFGGSALKWQEREGRLIAVQDVYSKTDDTGASQPTIQFTAGGTDLLGSALSVSESVANSGVIASGQTVAFGEAIDIDCEATGTNKDSYFLYATFIFARII